MKWLLLFLTLLSTTFALQAQNLPGKHPRVMELEDKLTEEASLYFSRRHPNEPFFAKIEVTPLRRNVAQGASGDSLPYFDQDSEEIVDEWDDPTTPLSFLRSRVVKVKVNVSVPEKFDDLKIAEIKQEIPIYLNLLPGRDEISVERKFKHIQPETPHYIYYILGSLLVSSLVIGFMVRWSVSKMKSSASQTSPGSASGAINTNAAISAKPRSSNIKGSTAVSGEVTFYDPIKTLDIVHIKIKQITDSGTFPTLKDLLLMSDTCQKNPKLLGTMVCELPRAWQKTLLWMGRDQKWLEAFSSPGQIGQEGLILLDQMSRQRNLTGGDRQWEDLLIQVWRLGDKANIFFKKINPEHAFIILGLLPKSISLPIAKKCFPGAWGKLLENKPLNVVIDTKVIADYLAQAFEIAPAFEWKMVEEYNKDKEILNYLSLISIEEERDIYETLNKDSFIFSVRPPFYKVFEMQQTELSSLIQAFSLEQWALSVVNSSRSYIKVINDQLDDKRKIIFSSYLKNYDQNPPEIVDQAQIRQTIALHAEATFLSKNETQVDSETTEESKSINEKSA